MGEILVFGALGQVGQELAEFDDVKALSRVEADLTTPDICVEHILNTDAKAVINAAAYTLVDRAEEEDALNQLVNGKAVGMMAAAAASRGLPFVTISTDYVFSGKGDAPWQPDDKTDPVNAYGRAKLKGEKATQKAGGAYAILRTSWVFGATGRNFVKSILRLGQENDRLDIIDDQFGGPTPARDIAGACRQMAWDLVNAPEKSGIYHFAGMPDVSWAGFAHEIFRQSQTHCEIREIPTSDYPTPAKRPLNSRLDCRTTTAAFGIERPDWREGLQDVLVEWGEYRL